MGLFKLRIMASLRYIYIYIYIYIYVCVFVFVYMCVLLNFLVSIDVRRPRTLSVVALHIRMRH